MTTRSIIDEMLDKRSANGDQKFGDDFDDVHDGRDWTLEVIEELIDGLRYAAKEIQELREQLKTPFDA